MIILRDVSGRRTRGDGLGARNTNFDNFYVIMELSQAEEDGVQQSWHQVAEVIEVGLIRCVTDILCLIDRSG